MTSYVAHSGPTARIEVRYQAPIPLTGARLVYLECRVDMVERGTKVWMSAEMRLGGPTGPIHATATGLWIREDIHSWFDLASGGVKCTYCIQKKIRKNCRASQNRRRCGRRARRGCTLFSARFQPCLVPPPPHQSILSRSSRAQAHSNSTDSLAIPNADGVVYRVPLTPLSCCAGLRSCNCTHARPAEARPLAVYPGGGPQRHGEAATSAAAAAAIRGAAARSTAVAAAPARPGVHRPRHDPYSRRRAGQDYAG